MRLCLAARALTLISIALMVAYAYVLEVRGPYWPVWPHSWRTIAELGVMVYAVAAPVSAVLAAHRPDLHDSEPSRFTFTPRP
jgi:hypothetical protein